jgi:hypothetical protein
MIRVAKVHGRKPSFPRVVSCSNEGLLPRRNDRQATIDAESRGMILALSNQTGAIMNVVRQPRPSMAAGTSAIRAWSRRSFILRTSAAVVAPVTVFAQDARQNFGGSWTVPRGTVHRLELGKLGLNLEGALAAVDEWRIPSTSLLILQIPDGQYEMDKTIRFEHRDGSRLSVMGNQKDPSQCVLRWAKSESGFYIGAGNVLGFLDGVTLRHVAKAARGASSGLLADEGGVARCGSSVEVVDFYYGFTARRSGALRCGGTRVRGAGDAAYFAFATGHISAPKARAEGTRDEAAKLGSGFVSEYGSSIDAEGAISSKNFLAGFNALSNGVIRAYDSVAEGNLFAGYYANTGGEIVAHRGVSRSNCGEGIVERAGGRVAGAQMRVESNQLEAANCKFA